MAHDEEGFDYKSLTSVPVIAHSSSLMQCMCRSQHSSTQPERGGGQMKGETERERETAT